MTQYSSPLQEHAIVPGDKAIDRVNVLGVGVSAINMTQALQTIDGWIERRERHYICVTGVHGVMESQRDETLREIHNDAGLVTPDGMPLVWLSRLNGYRHVERVYGPDSSAARLVDRSESMRSRRRSSRSSRAFARSSTEDGMPMRAATAVAEEEPGVPMWSR